MKPLSDNIFAHTGMLLAMTVMLSACGNTPKKEKLPPLESQQTQQSEASPVIKPVGVLTPDLRTDFNTALGFIKSGEYNKAIALLTQVSEQLPNNPEPYVNLALAYGKTGNTNLAEKNFQLALAIDPGNPVASNEYAILKRKGGKFFEARKLYEQALERHPDFHVARKNLGILCDLYMRDYKCALKHYQIYSNAAPEDKVAKIWLADMQKKLGQ